MCHGSHGFVLQNGRSNRVLVNGSADVKNSVLLTGGNDGNGNLLSNVCCQGIVSGKYGCFPLGRLRGLGSIHKNASLSVVLINNIAGANVRINLIIGLRIVHKVGNRIGLGSVRNVDRFSALYYKLTVLKHSVTNILEHSVGERCLNLISIRICSAVDSLHGIGIVLGNDDTVESIDFVYGLSIEKKCCGRLKRLNEHAVGCIPLGIIKILVELNSTLAVLPFLLILSSLNSKIEYGNADAQGYESCTEAEEYVEHGVMPSFRLCCLPFSKGGDRNSEQH